MTLKTINRCLICILFVCFTSIFFTSCTKDEDLYNGSIVGFWINRYEYSSRENGQIFDILCFDENGRGGLKTYIDGRPYYNYKLFSYSYFGYRTNDEENKLIMFKEEKDYNKTNIYYDDKYTIGKNTLILGGKKYDRFIPKLSEYAFIPQMEYITETSLGRVSSLFDWMITSLRGEKVKITCKVFVPGNKYEILDSYLVTNSGIVDSNDTVNVKKIMNDKGEFSYEFSTERFMNKHHQYCNIKLYTTYRLLGPVCGETENTAKEFVIGENFPSLYFDFLSKTSTKDM